MSNFLDLVPNITGKPALRCYLLCSCNKILFDWILCPSLLSTQALADLHLHHVCCSLLRVWHLRNVHVLLVQAPGQRARGGLGCTPAHELSTDQLLASRVPHGAAPCCHGHRLLPRFCGNCHTLLFLSGWVLSEPRGKYSTELSICN